jgi:hypothetical protein
VEGYAKPLFADLDVCDSEQDAADNPLRKAWEAVVGATSELLANRERGEVATVTDLSRRIENPDASVWQILGGLLRNAFFQAILPGLERGRG